MRGRFFPPSQFPKKWCYKTQRKPSKNAPFWCCLKKTQINGTLWDPEFYPRKTRHFGGAIYDDLHGGSYAPFFDFYFCKKSEKSTKSKDAIGFCGKIRHFGRKMVDFLTKNTKKWSKFDVKFTDYTLETDSILEHAFCEI